MTQTQIQDMIKDVMLSVDREKVQKSKMGNALPARTLFYDQMSEKEKTEMKALCGKNYPGGELVAFAGLRQKDGFVFTTEGIFATKNFFFTSGLLGKKQIPMPIKYKDVAEIHQCGPGDRMNSGVFCSLTLKDQKEITLAVPAFAAYISLVLTQIGSALKAQKNPIKAPSEPEKKVKEPKKQPTTDDLFDQMWEEAKAIPSPVPTTAGKPEVKVEARPEAKPEVKDEARPEAKPEVKVEARREAKPEVKVEAKPEAKSEVKVETRPYRNRIHMISDGERDAFALEFYEGLQKALCAVGEDSFSLSEFSSSDEAQKALLSDAFYDHLLIYVNLVTMQYERIRQQLFQWKPKKYSKVIVYFDQGGWDDQETVELLEQEITELYDEIYRAPEQVKFVIGDRNFSEESLENIVKTLQKECKELHRHTLPFRMPVKEAFSVKRKDGGTVEIVSGKITQGCVKPGDKICLMDSDGAPEAVVKMILDLSRRDFEAAYPEMEVDLFLEGVPKEAVRAGKLAAAQTEDLCLRDRFVASVYVLTKAEGGGFSLCYEGKRSRLVIGKEEMLSVVTRIFRKEKLPGGALGAGSFGMVEIQTERKLPLEAGTAFALYDDDKKVTIGVVEADE